MCLTCLLKLSRGNGVGGTRLLLTSLENWLSMYVRWSQVCVRPFFWRGTKDGSDMVKVV